MNRRSTFRIPALPVRARKAGATKVNRCLADGVFAVGFKIVGDDYNAPGCGQAVVDALTQVWGSDAKITWDGRQCDTIGVDFR